MYTLSCDICGKNFNHSHKHTKTCSKECHRKRILDLYGINNSGLATNYCGAIHEYKTYLYLSEKNIQVYNQFLPSSKIDAMIVTPSGKIMTMDVKTGYRSKLTGNVAFPKHTHSVDIIAIYIKNTKEVVLKNSKGKEISIEDLK